MHLWAGLSWGFSNTLGRWVPSTLLILNRVTGASRVLEKSSF